MSPSNAEILVQLERLADAQETYGTRLEQTGGLPSFRELLAAVKRWVKIEKAARECRRLDLWSVDSESFGSDCDITDEMEQWFDKHRKAHATAYSILDAALKEPS